MLTGEDSTVTSPSVTYSSVRMTKLTQDSNFKRSSFRDYCTVCLRTMLIFRAGVSRELHPAPDSIRSGENPPTHQRVMLVRHGPQVRRINPIIPLLDASP